MPTAFNLIRKRWPERFDAFCAGFRACGYDVADAWTGAVPRPDDVLAIWNRIGGWAEAADAFERAGARVVVAENGWLPVGSEKTIALALGGHNGTGAVPSGGPDRWHSWNVTLAPWRRPTGDDVVLIAGQRGIGAGDQASPIGWADRAIDRIRTVSALPIRWRAHPGADALYARPPTNTDQISPPNTPLADDLAAARVLVTWTSSVAAAALLAGVPVIVCGPKHALDAACGHDLRRIDAPAMPDRLGPFRRLAWAQWTLPEIASGEAFRHLLGASTAAAA